MAGNMKSEIEGHKLNYHSDKVADWLRGEKVYPVYVEFGTTSACNHRCTFCALDFTGYKGKSLDTDILAKALIDMGKKGVKACMFGGEGEPTLHKDFSFLVEHAKKSGLDVALTTNGVPFTRKKAEQCLGHLSWVKFSIDAGTPETYAKLHGTKLGDFERLMDNIKASVEIKNKNGYSVTIGTQILLVDDNACEVIGLASRVKDIGVDYLVVKPYSQHPDSSHKVTVDYSKFDSLQQQLETLNSEDFEVIFRSKTMHKLNVERSYTACYGASFFALVDAEGNVIPCNLFYGKADFYYGNLYKNTFSEIWEGEKRQNVLGKLCKGTDNCRENCRLDSVNRYLHLLKNPPDHVNFI